jgi:undecaprenyl-diphosphatase
MGEARDDLLTAIALGVVQGVTEFLPISSDGHLALFGLLFEVPEVSLATTVALHLGTLAATLLMFRTDLTQLTKRVLASVTSPRALFESTEGRLIACLFVASLPTAAIGLSLEDAVEPLSRSPWAVGLGFLGSAAAVFSTRGRAGSATELSLRAALIVGTFQGLAVLPGLSRSASTIAAALALGLAPSAAFRFSFLLSLPAVAGAALLELGKPGALAGLSHVAWIGAGIAFVAGLVALRLLRGLLAGGRFWLFGLYLIPLGAALVLWDVLAR